MIGRPSLRDGTCREALSVDWEWSEVPPEGRLALPEVWEWSGGSTGGPAVVRRPTRRSGCGREAIMEVREWLGGPPKGPGVVRR